MSSFTQLKNWISPRLAVLVAFGVASLSVVLWHALVTREHAQIKLAVEQTTHALSAEIKERVEPKILALVRMARRWEAQGGTSREEWEADALLYLTHQTGQQSISWVDSSYHVRWPAPLEGREIYEGVNVAREEQRRLVLDTARERREVGVTRVVELFGGRDGIPCFCTPVRG